MLKNYLKVAIKILLRRKFYTAISLFGIAFTLMVLLVVVSMADHLFAPLPPEVKLGRTLQISWIMAKKEEGERKRLYQGSPGYALLDQCARDIPGVENMSIFSDLGTATTFVNGEKVESRIRYTDGEYWEILDFDFVEGGPFTADDERDGHFVAVINEATRKRIFGGAAAVGRLLSADGRQYRVVGVVKNVAKTRLSAEGDLWVPLNTVPSQEFRNELMGDFSAILLAESKDEFPGIKAEYESRLAHVDTEGMFDTIDGTAMTRFESAALTFGRGESGKPDVRQAVLVWAAMIAAFLFLPTINLISINVSRIYERSSEIGIRKAFGASSLHLVGQFIVENIFLCLIGGAVALAAAAGVLGVIEKMDLVPYADFTINFRVFLYALALAVFLGLLSGVFPAWRMSRLHPVRALHGGVR